MPPAPAPARRPQRSWFVSYPLLVLLWFGGADNKMTRPAEGGHFYVKRPWTLKAEKRVTLWGENHLQI